MSIDNIDKAIKDWFDRENDPEKCSDCGKKLHKGDWPYCPHGNIWNRDAQVAAPTVVFRNKNGKYRFPGRSNAPTPKGYQRIELSTQRARDKFEREYGAIETAKLRENWYQEQANWEQTLKHNMPGLEKLRDMSPLGKQYYDQCMADIERRRAQPPPDSAGFHIETNHFYSQSRDSWCDKDTGWKDRK